MNLNANAGLMNFLCFLYFCDIECFNIKKYEKSIFIIFSVRVIYECWCFQ